ncbi:MAG: SH3 domain-containing protein [Chloroflexi bacterium]|nr:SH3 domain-containing protein [Chloroflexota bacterium]
MRCILILTLLLLVACTQPPPQVVVQAEPEPSPTDTVDTVVPSPPTAEPTLTPAPSATLTATPAPTSTTTPTPTPQPERVRVSGENGSAVNMRREPGTNAPVVKSLRDGAEVTIAGVDRDENGRIWRNVRDGDDVGWIVSTALRSQPTPTITPSATVTPSATATTAATATRELTGTAAAATPSPTSGGSATPAGTPAPERIEITGTGGGGANLRAEPGTSARILQTIPDGTQLTIVGPDREVGGRTWRNVRGQGGTTGWVAADSTQPLAEPTPAITLTPTPTAPPGAQEAAATSATPTISPPPESTASSTPAAASTPTIGTPTASTPTTSSAGAPSPAEDAPAEEPTPEPQRVEVYDTGTTGANLRARPGRSGSVLRSVPDGAVLTIIGEDQVADGIIWRNVQMEDGTKGWLAVETVRPLVIPTPTPRPGAPGIGAPIVDESLPDDELSEEQRAATPCRPGQLKGDFGTGVYYPPDHPEYAGLRQRVRCFDNVSRAQASGYRAADPPAAPSPSPGPE